MTCLKSGISILCLFLLGACSGPGYFEPTIPVAENGAVLYLYRPKADNPGAQPLRNSYPDLRIDDISVGVLKFNHHSSVQIEAGEHILRATGLSPHARWKPKDRELKFKIAPGEVKYIKLSVAYNLEKMPLVNFEDKYLIFLTPMSAKDAAYEIRETKAQ